MNFVNWFNQLPIHFASLVCTLLLQVIQFYSNVITTSFIPYRIPAQSVFQLKDLMIALLVVCWMKWIWKCTGLDFMIIVCFDIILMCVCVHVCSCVSCVFAAYKEFWLNKKLVVMWLERIFAIWNKGFIEYLHNNCQYNIVEAVSCWSGRRVKH